MSVSSNLMGGCPKAIPSITVMLGVGACWPQVVLGVTLATNGVVLWVPVTKFEVMPGLHNQHVIRHSADCGGSLYDSFTLTAFTCNPDGGCQKKWHVTQI